MTARLEVSQQVHGQDPYRHRQILILSREVGEEVDELHPQEESPRPPVPRRPGMNRRLLPNIVAVEGLRKVSEDVRVRLVDVS